MATQEEITALKMIVGGANDFTDEELGYIIDANPEDMDSSAAVVWEIRAAKYHGLVNMSESGSSRNLGDMHKNALAMAAYYRSKNGAGEEPGEAVGVTRTRRIVRG